MPVEADVDSELTPVGSELAVVEVDVDTLATPWQCQPFRPDTGELLRRPLRLENGKRPVGSTKTDPPLARSGMGLNRMLAANHSGERMAPRHP